jgi:hypothetical protein
VEEKGKPKSGNGKQIQGLLNWYLRVWNGKPPEHLKHSPRVANSAIAKNLSPFGKIEPSKFGMTRRKRGMIARKSVLQNLGREIDTKPVKVVNGYLKKIFWKKGFGLIFAGAPGIGKTHALIKAIAVLLRLQRVHQPVYIPFTELSNEEIRSRLDIYDAILLDDINVSLPEWKWQLLEEILFRLYNRGAFIFLTSNSSLEELRNSLSGAIWSRLEERCIFQEFPEGEDIRRRLKKERLEV